jgi:hypothetical protein
VDAPRLKVRHPLYSAVMALWLGAALGTLNWLLLALSPLGVAHYSCRLVLRKGCCARGSGRIRNLRGAGGSVDPQTRRAAVAFNNSFMVCGYDGGRGGDRAIELRSATISRLVNRLSKKAVMNKQNVRLSAAQQGDRSDRA